VYRKNREREGNLKLEGGWCAHWIEANTIILNWQRPLWEGARKYWRSLVRWTNMVVIHMFMETMLGISLCSYLYLKLAETLSFSYYLSCFLFNKVREQEGKTGSAWKQRRWWGNNVYTCK
jgi:hypothetical protein